MNFLYAFYGIGITSICRQMSNNARTDALCNYLIAIIDLTLYRFLTLSLSFQQSEQWAYFVWEDLKLNINTSTLPNIFSYLFN